MFPLENGAFEMLVLGALALIIVGPKDLPMLMRKVGQFTAKMRGLAAEFRASFDEMARQSELDELRKEVDALRTGHTTAPISGEIDKAFYDYDQTPARYSSPPDIPPVTDEGKDHALHEEGVVVAAAAPPPSALPPPMIAEAKAPKPPRARKLVVEADTAVASKPRKPRAKAVPAPEPEA